MNNKESNLFVSTLQSKPFRHYFFIALSISLSLCTLVCIADFIFGLTPLIFGTGETEIENTRSIATELIIAEVSSAFIIVTLSNVFSSTSQKAYWTDTLHHRLISPKRTNFTALSGYIMATMLVGLLFYIIEHIIRADHVISIFVSFMASVILMIILTARLIDSNFGREKVKNELEADLKVLREEAGSPHHIGVQNDLIIHEVNKLVDVSFQEILDGEMEYVYENLSLLARQNCMGAFDKIYRYVQVQDSYSIIKDTFLSRLVFQSAIDGSTQRVIALFSKTLDPKTITSSWEGALYIGFNKARGNWKKGDKASAFDIRAALYKALTEHLYQQYLKIDYERNCGSSDEDLVKQWAQIAYLMLLFMELREDPLCRYFNVPAFEGCNNTSLPGYEGWRSPEWDSIDKDEEILANRIELIQQVTQTQKIWEYKLGFADNYDGEYAHTLLEKLNLNNY